MVSDMDTQTPTPSSSLNEGLAHASPATGRSTESRQEVDEMQEVNEEEEAMKLMGLPATFGGANTQGDGKKKKKKGKRKVEEGEGDERKKIAEGVQQHVGFFSDEQCKALEEQVEDTRKIADEGGFKERTVDVTSKRVKMFFGYGYTYGKQVRQPGEPTALGGLGKEKVYPPGQVDPIPQWITDDVIKPLEEGGVVARGWVNSVVINDYKEGGFIVSHIDPIHIFERPIVSVCLFSDGALSFGCRFTFQPTLSVSRPTYLQSLPRGSVTLLSGYAADDVTHCVRPKDTKGRRVSIIMRRVKENAPIAEGEEMLVGGGTGRKEMEGDGGNAKVVREEGETGETVEGDAEEGGGDE